MGIDCSIPCHIKTCLSVWEIHKQKFLLARVAGCTTSKGYRQNALSLDWVTQSTPNIRKRRSQQVIGGTRKNPAGRGKGERIPCMRG